MMGIVFGIPNPMVGEAALPYFSLSAEDCAQSVGRAAFDELNRTLKGYIVSRCKQQVHVFRHDYESVDFVIAVATISEESCEEYSYIVLDNEESSAPPSAGSYKVSSGRRDESSRLQDEPQWLKP